MTGHGPRSPLYSPGDQIYLSPLYISSLLLTESLTVSGEDDSRVGDRDIVPTSLPPYDSLAAKVWAAKGMDIDSQDFRSW